MSKLLTTKGIGFFIDELFKSSKEFIYIVTPYFKVDSQLEERISDSLDNGVKIILIYGKDRNQIKSLKSASKIEVYFYENLHAKFYINEKNILITSMNMHSFSEANNREIGVLFSTKEVNDKTVIDDCLKEFESIRKQAVKISEAINKNKILNTETNTISDYNHLNSKYYPIVKDILIEKLGITEREISENANFVNDFGADSLDLVELIMEFEKTFNIDIPEGEAENITTIREALEYLDIKQPQILDKIDGYCIRTGIKIPFNIEKPLSYDAYKKWNKLKDPNFPENFCHYSGEPSNGNTSVSKPILKKNWKKANESNSDLPF